MNQINKFALKLFGGLIGDKPELQKSLRQAHIYTPVEGYLAATILYSIIAGAIGFAISYITVGLLLAMSTTYTLLIVLGAGFGTGLGTYGFGLAYPSILSSTIKAKIDRQLPNATLYLYAQTSGGVSLIQAFKSLSRQKEEYGEITEDFNRIVERVEYFREDIRTAISEVAKNTSSNKLREFLETLTSVVLTGSSLPEFFSRKHEEFKAESKLQEERDLETLGLLAESYVISLGLGPLLIIVMLIVIGLMGMVYTSLLWVVIYGMIPLGSIAFLVLLDTILISPVKETEEESLESGESDYLPTENEESAEESEKSEEDITSPSIFTRLKNIPGALGENPYYILAISSSIAILFVFMEIFYSTLGLEYAGILMGGANISLIPFIIAYELQAHKIKKVEDRLPDFFRSLSGTLRAGLSLPRAIESLPIKRLGILSSFAKKLQKDISWGYPSKKALNKFGKNTKSGIASSVMTTITNAYEAGGDMAEVMDINAESIRDRLEMRTMRFNTMMVYTIVIYLTFAVYLVSIYALTTQVLGGLPEEMQTEAVAGAGGLRFDVPFKMGTFLHAGMIQGFCSGIIAGKFSTGKLLGGLKHSIIMASIAYLAFTILIF